MCGTAKARILDIAFPSLWRVSPLGPLALLLQPCKMFPNISCCLQYLFHPDDQVCTPFHGTYDLLYSGFHPGLPRSEGRGTFSAKTGMVLGKARRLVTLCLPLQLSDLLLSTLASGNLCVRPLLPCFYTLSLTMLFLLSQHIPLPFFLSYFLLFLQDYILKCRYRFLQETFLDLNVLSLCFHITPHRPLS